MNQHLMELKNVHSSGEEEWHCPTCGRRFLLQMPPNYKKTVLEPGDESVSHAGSNFGLVLGGLSVNQTTQDAPPMTAPDIEQDLGGDSQVEISQSLRKWLKDAGLDKLL